jgi:hypothetical protein
LSGLARKELVGVERRQELAWQFFQKKYEELVANEKNKVNSIFGVEARRARMAASKRSSGIPVFAVLAGVKQARGTEARLHHK